MAAAIVGAGVGLYGAYQAQNQLPGKGKISKRNSRRATFEPLIFQFLQSGGSIDQLRVGRRQIGVKKGKKGYGAKGAIVGAGFGPAEAYLGSKFGERKDKKKYEFFNKATGETISKADTITIGKDGKGKQIRVAIGGEGPQKILEAQFKKAHDRQVANIGENFDKLFGDNGPSFLRDKITNRPQQLRDALGPTTQRLLQGALGGAAARGTLSTEAVQTRAAAPVALAFENQIQNAQNVTNAQQLGLSGVPGFGPGFGSNPTNFTTPQSLPFLAGLGSNAFGQNLQAQGLSASLQAAGAGATAGAYGGLSQSLLGNFG